MADIIDEIFATFREGFIQPLSDNLSDVVGPVWALAMCLAVLSLVFGFFGKDKGPKLAVVGFLVLFALVWFGYKEEMLQRLTSGDVAVQASVDQADEALSAVAEAQRS